VQFSQLHTGAHIRSRSTYTQTIKIGKTFRGWTDGICMYGQMDQSSNLLGHFLTLT